MTDTVAASEPAAAPLPEPAAAPRRVKPIRWWGLIVLLALGVLSLAVLPFVVQPWVLGKLRNGLAANGWELTPESQLSFSLYGATLHGEHLTLRMIKPGADGKQEQVATADRLHAELALFASLTSSDVVIRELAAEGLTGNLRRGPDGRIATAPPATTDEKSAGTDWSKVDWAGWYQKAMDRWKQRQDEQKRQKTDEPKPAGQPAPTQPVEAARPPAEPDVAWPKATKYQPLPKGDRHVPRVVIRTLAVSGTAVKLPDDSPFEVQRFAFDGHNISLRQDAGETMDLTGKITTRGAGDLSLDLLRKADDTGHLRIAAPAVPVEALSHPAIAGDRLARYGASGVANITSDSAWTGWDLIGSLDAQVSGLVLKPTTTDAETARAATAINALHGKPIAWPVKFGGTLYAPTVTDSGLEAVLKGSAKDAAVGAAKDKATEEATKQLDKNPQAKEAADKLKSLFGK